MNKISHEMFFTINPNSAYTLIDDEAVIMAPDDDQLYSANATAADVWQLLEKSPNSIPMMHTWLMERFEVDSEACLNDIEHLITGLLDKNLILAVDNS